ncbi:hypothetical protein BJ138DRAFT_1014032 [Hygrophoropsis aurantiaca]|uniref:Uncharacterized protein n=1 Tax=Hygrophoropsis aurantiaca TaxID=72124 RepID=A0ACB8A3X5_9AGAM|nr:hypothetical protein BJ138DRAFT_1014032 [Hygrophoropsis aurantiaca]
MSLSGDTTTPAARLRALLARVPHSPPQPRQQPVPPPASDADIGYDSDFDPPRSSTGSVSGSVAPSSSIARESLKDLFSHALREPGDTPRKNLKGKDRESTGRPRRNSIDTSAVDITPILDRERAKHKGKRRSLSDEEVEIPSASCLFFSVYSLFIRAAFIAL